MVRCGFGDQGIGVTVNEFPAIAFAAEEFGHAQIERDRFWPATQMSRGALETNPVGQAVARRHVQNLKLALAATLEAGGISLVL